MNWLSIFSLASALIYLYLGLLAVHKDSKSPTNMVFFGMCMSLALWAFAYSFVYSGSLDNITKVFYYNRFSSMGWITFPALMFHFGLLITESDRHFHKNKWRLLLLALYLPTAVMFFQNITGTLFITGFVQTAAGLAEVVDGSSIWFYFYNIYLLLYLPGYFILLYLWGRRSPDRRRKKQARVIVLSGLAVLLAGFTSNLLLPALGYIIPSLACIFAIVWATGIWIAIEKYNLMSLNFGMAADQILETVKDYLVLINPEGKIVKVNLELKNELGCDDSISGSYLRFLFYERESIDSYIAPLKAGKAPEQSMELHFLSSEAGQELIPVRVSSSPIHDKAGDLIGAVITGHDLRQTRQLQEQIREISEAEEALRQSNEKLKELDQLKTDFLSSVSHELRTPLTSILGFASIIRKRFEEVLLPLINTEEKKAARAVRQLQENIGIIISEGQRLTTLINEVLDIAKMEAGRTDWKMENLELHKVVKSAMAATAPLFEEKGLSLKQKLAMDLPPLQGDRDRLVQVFINLLSNGMKFTETGGVTIQAARHGTGEILVRVVDTGIGISPEDHEKVFEKFKQAGDTLTDKPKGTGLGLPICKEIVEHHGGRIWVESVPGEGSSFCFILPLEPQQQQTAGPDPWQEEGKEAPAAAPGTGGKPLDKTILVVDDEENIRKYLRTELGDRGYQVREAVNGKTALEIMGEQQPDLIILDVMMPVMNGFEMLETLKKDPETASIPVIILTVTDDRERALRLSVNGYFTKPVDMGALLANIDELLSGGDLSAN